MCISNLAAFVSGYPFLPPWGGIHFYPGYAQHLSFTQLLL
jgi:hypothetical protein